MNKSQSNTENLLSNMKYIVDKCREVDVKNILKSCLVYTTRVSLEVLDKIHEERSIFVLVLVVYILIIVLHLYEDILFLLQSGKKVLFDVISYLNCNFVMHPRP